MIARPHRQQIDSLDKVGQSDSGALEIVTGPFTAIHCPSMLRHQIPIQNVKDKVHGKEASRTNSCQLQHTEGERIASLNNLSPKKKIFALCAIGCRFLLRILIPVLVGEEIEYRLTHNRTRTVSNYLLCLYSFLFRALPCRSSLYIRLPWQTA